MEEIEKKIENMRLKEEEEDEENESNEPNEKLTNRQIRLMRIKNKKEEKKRNKQSSKNTNEKNQLNPNSKENNSNEENVSIKKKNHDLPETQGGETNGLNIENPIDATTDKKKIEPIIVEYCKICGMPYEYCEYGKYYDECKEANKEKYNYELNDTGKVDAEAKKKVKKPEKNINQKITIQKVTRAKKKVVTVITGLHPYVKLEKMAKIFSRLYACGSSVIKGTNGAPDQIDIQGDVEQLVAEEIMKNCPEISQDQIKILPPK